MNDAMFAQMPMMWVRNFVWIMPATAIAMNLMLPDDPLIEATPPNVIAGLLVAACGIAMTLPFHRAVRAIRRTNREIERRDKLAEAAKERMRPASVQSRARAGFPN